MGKPTNKRRRKVNGPYRDPYLGPPPQPQKQTTVFFEVGNDLDSNDGIWSVYVDVLSGNWDLIESVKFANANYTVSTIVHCPVPITLSDGVHVQRYFIRSTLPLTGRSSRKFLISILGRGRTRRRILHRVPSKRTRRCIHGFYEHRPLRPRSYLPLPSIHFGIELEISCSQGTPVKDVASYLSQQSISAKEIMNDYHNAKVPFDGWKLVHDGSIVCSRAEPDCSLFELVSPKLCGNEGMGHCHRVLEALKGVSLISVNKSMGFHVHVSVENLSLDKLKNICLNFIKYEHVIDTFMPLSRRKAKHTYCQSNSDAMYGDSYGMKYNAIVSCRTLQQLCDTVNPGNDRYYKLNMQNLRTKRQETLEFRQHSGTSNYKKIEAWVRFCVAFVHHSAQQPRPSALQPEENAFDALFQRVVKDLALREYYVQRRLQLHTEPENEADEAGNNLKKSRSSCCDRCANGGTCAFRNANY